MTRSEIDKQAAINAVLAKNVYNPSPEGKKVEIQGETFRVLKNVSYGSGFQATIYYNEETNQVHGVVRGTELEFSKEGAKDLLYTDVIGMGLFKHNPQIKDAEKFAELLIETAREAAEDRKDKLAPKIVLAGHSLGGTHAQYLSHYLGDRVFQTFTYNAYGAASLGYRQRVPHDENVPVYNYRTSNDIVSGSSMHYGKVFTYKIPEKEDVIGHGIGHFTDTGGKINIFSPTAKQDGIVELELSKHTWHEYASKGFRGFVTYANPINAADGLAYKMHIYKTPDAGKRADADGIPVYKADQVVKSAVSIGQYMMELNQMPFSQQDVRQPEILDKPETPNREQPVNTNTLKNANPEISPQAQQLYQQCEEKLIALCKEKNITADNPQDFKNIAMALTAKALEHQMTKVDKMDFGKGDMLYILSNQPHAVLASVAANDVVNIPITESMAKIQQIEQQQTQLAQERQVSQSQSQQHGISLA